MVTWLKNFMRFNQRDLKYKVLVVTLLLEEWEDDTHTPEMGTWESTKTPEISKLDSRGQNTSHWGVLYVIK
jgi:hypothetical protein